MANSSEDIEAKLNAFVEGDLDEAGAAEIEQHLRQNPRHRQLLADLQAGRKLVQELPVAEAPADVFETAQVSLERSALLDGSIEAEAAGGRGGGFPLMAVAAVLVLALTLGVVVVVMVGDPPAGTQVALSEDEPHEPIRLLDEGENELELEENRENGEVVGVEDEATARGEVVAGDVTLRRGAMAGSGREAGGGEPGGDADELAAGERPADELAADELAAGERLAGANPSAGPGVFDARDSFLMPPSGPTAPQPEADADAFARLPTEPDAPDDALAADAAAVDAAAVDTAAVDTAAVDALAQARAMPRAGEALRVTGDDGDQGTGTGTGGWVGQQMLVVVTADDPSLAALNVSNYLAQNSITARALPAAAAAQEAEEKAEVSQKHRVLQDFKQTAPQAGLVIDELDEASARRLVAAMNMPGANQSAAYELPARQTTSLPERQSDQQSDQQAGQDGQRSAQAAVPRADSARSDEPAARRPLAGNSAGDARAPSQALLPEGRRARADVDAAMPDGPEKRDLGRSADVLPDGRRPGGHVERQDRMQVVLVLRGREMPRVPSPAGAADGVPPPSPARLQPVVPESTPSSTAPPSASPQAGVEPSTPSTRPAPADDRQKPPAERP